MNQGHTVVLNGSRSHCSKVVIDILVSYSIKLLIQTFAILLIQKIAITGNNTFVLIMNHRRFMKVIKHS